MVDTAPSVSQSTGTLAVRGILKNDNRALLPGYFVRVRVPIGRVDRAIFVPEAAVGSDQSGRYVFVVNKDNVVEQRPVQIGAVTDGKRVVESGLHADDRVIVAGLLRAVPGQKVDPQTEPAASR